MEIGKIISKYRKENKLSQMDIADSLSKYGFSLKKSAVSAWETGISQPNTEQFLALCKILEITDIYNIFIGGHNPDDPMAELNDIGKAKALDYIQLLLKSGEYQKEDSGVLQHLRDIKLFCLPASAGTGEFLDSEDFEVIQVGNDVPDTADFGIRINGDSMEPRYVNGQIVWVQQISQLEDGEIGIFYLDGNAYCKKLQDNKKGLYLISLNTKYNPIKITENSAFRTFGRVVG